MAESPDKPTSDNKQTAPSGAEVIFLIFLVAFGMGLSVWGERAFSLVFKQPTEQQFLDQRDIKGKQGRLAQLETAIKESEKQLDTLDLENLKHTALLQTIEKSHPEIRSPSPVGAGASTTSGSTALKDYENAKMQQLAANEYATLLKSRLASLKAQAQQSAQDLERDKETAEREFSRQKWIYMLKKSAASFLLPLPIVLLALFIGAFFFNRVTKRRGWISRGSVPVLLVVGALLILLAYQAFEVAGAVLIGMILFLFLLRKIDWAKVAAK